ncbi:hypothetical protein [Paraliobacillus sp. X-1268]|nr:hypothetical protein [Paraliobacillus sp. X-1268]
MAVGGLMAEAFKIFLGNPDIMAFVLTFMVASTLMLTIIEANKETEI